MSFAGETGTSEKVKCFMAFRLKDLEGETGLPFMVVDGCLDLGELAPLALRDCGGLDFGEFGVKGRVDLPNAKESEFNLTGEGIVLDTPLVATGDLSPTSLNFGLFLTALMDCLDKFEGMNEEGFDFFGVSFFGGADSLKLSWSTVPELGLGEGANVFIPEMGPLFDFTN